MVEWSVEDALLLIQAYEKKPIIWDPKHPQHFKKNLKDDEWKELSPTSKVTRWFEMLQPLSRPESGFVDAPEGEEEGGPEEPEGPEAAESLLRRLPMRKRKKLLGLRIGRVTTF